VGNVEDFSKIIDFTLRWEGGLVDDPDDPGGLTNFGISKRYHPDVDVRNLTRETATEWYYDKIWLGYKCDKDTHPNNIVIFEIAVNPGPKLLYMIPSGFDWKDLIIWRLDYYMDRVSESPKKVKYIGGWDNRTMELYFKILKGEL